MNIFSLLRLHGLAVGCIFVLQDIEVDVVMDFGAHRKLEAKAKSNERNCLLIRHCDPEIVSFIFQYLL